MKYGADKLRERRCSGRGFTLVEMMIGISVLGLILLGSVSLYVAMTRLTASVSGTTSVTLDAANASQRVVEDLRDAQNFMLLDATGKEVTTGLTGSGLRIFYPSPLGDVKVNTNTGTATLTKNHHSFHGALRQDDQPQHARPVPVRRERQPERHGELPLDQRCGERGRRAGPCPG